MPAAQRQTYRMLLFTVYQEDAKINIFNASYRAPEAGSPRPQTSIPSETPWPIMPWRL